MTPLADQETGPMVKKVLIGLLILVVGLLAGGAIPAGELPIERRSLKNATGGTLRWMHR